MDREIYIAENGLEHCAICNEPLEQFLPENVQAIFGITKHSRQCACIRERNAREAKERKEASTDKQWRVTPRCALRNAR